MAESPDAQIHWRLLLVDDEHSIRTSMSELLQLRGYHIDEAGNGPEALTALTRQPYDLMVLDMQLPGMHGVEVMRRARELRPDLAIIVLTAHATVESAIASVKSDVTDYMLKPCNFDDLAVTIERSLAARAKQQRRLRMLELVGEAMNMLVDDDAAPAAAPIPVAAANPIGLPATTAPGNDDTLRVGTLTLDRQKRLAILDIDPARLVELTEGEVSVLETLMQHPNKVLSVKELANSALGYQGLDKWTLESVVRSCVFRLRQKIEPAPDSPQLICTVRGRGYFFRAGDPVAARL
ncbi:MAG: response regulator transcription factor [Chloroflexi bacterium]|nr:response regulator transcription factor [Chloroflexota bacterium]